MIDNPTILATLWVVAMLLYLGSAIWLAIFRRDRYPLSASLAFFSIACFLFILINRRIVPQPEFQSPGFGYLSIGFLIVGWVAAMRLLRRWADGYQ